MKELITKVYAKFLLSILYTIITYWIVRYLFEFSLHIFPLDGVFIFFFLPIIISIFFLIKVFYPSLKKIKFKNSSSAYIIIFFSMGLNTICLDISKNFFEQISYSLVEVSEVSEINNYPKEKYFKINKEPNFDASIVIANHIYDDEDDEDFMYAKFYYCLDSIENIWGFFSYNIRYTNVRNIEKVLNKWKDQVSLEEKKRAVKTVKYFARDFNNSNHLGIVEDISYKLIENKKDPIFIEIYNSNFHNRFKQDLKLFILSYSILFLFMFILLVVIKLKNS